MNGEFITWGILGTYAGAVSITAIITQFLKKLPGLRRMDPQLLSYLVALVILEGATVFSGGFHWEIAALCLVNAMVVALASNGTYDVIGNKATPKKEE